MLNLPNSSRNYKRGGAIMADFYKQCSIDHFGKDYKDLANISTPEDTSQEKYAIVICEGCGFIQVNHLGECITKDCLQKHGV